MSLEFGGEPEQVGAGESLAEQRVAGDEARDGRGRGRPEAALEGDLVGHRDRPPRVRRKFLAAPRDECRLYASDEAVRAVGRKLAGPFAGDRQLDFAAAPRSNLELDLIDE